ncbi:MAG TPA: hypothetical protein ENG95_00850 [Nitrospirae bacterium]|nr:PilZ domain protein [bacterium BMS3Abin10]GBE38262.1 PilZ domain protein [bacterium BMS3Bbin08]HDH50389.1 hypothetical protein [Nitrospirota bacterium]HDK16370.1 hypothetical protein [Nitrospirota bacterium]HDK81056.1 hypothetical protein [Nitrospirota bacterium]
MKPERSERRRYTRLVIKSLDMKCKIHFDTDAKLTNISLSGACIRTGSTLKIGTEYELHLKSSKKELNVKGVVIWETMDKPQKGDKEAALMYETGIKFNDILTEKGVNLLDFLDEQNFAHRVKLRLRGVRLKIFRPKTGAAVARHKSYTVVKLSPGGMLIETDQRMESEDRLKMEMNIPRSTEPVKFLGRVASCVETSEEGRLCYGTGIEFIDMDEKDKAKLDRFIQSLLSM